MPQTKQQKIQQINSLIVERTSYLKTIEAQIEDVSNAANNRLFELHGQIDEAEKIYAKVLKKTYELDQKNRERERIA